MSQATSLPECQGVYSLSDPTTGEVFYVGASKNIRKRYYVHRHPGNPMRVIAERVQAIMRNGSEPVVTVLELVENGLADAEQRWITKMLASGHKLLNDRHVPAPKPEKPPGDPDASALGKKRWAGKTKEERSEFCSKAAKARLEKLTPERRAEIAAMGGRANSRESRAQRRLQS